MMDFDVVLATRSRTQALAISLPLLVEQSHRPAQIILIDSSDDPAPARAATIAVAGKGVPVHFGHGPKGSSHQRNRRLELVTTPITFSPTTIPSATPARRRP